MAFLNDLGTRIKSWADSTFINKSQMSIIVTDSKLNAKIGSVNGICGLDAKALIDEKFLPNVPVPANSLTVTSTEWSAFEQALSGSGNGSQSTL